MNGPRHKKIAIGLDFNKPAQLQIPFWIKNK